MKKIQFLGLSPECIEGFPSSIEKTFSGALHLRPSQVYDLSEEEFEHIKNERPDLKFYEFKTEVKLVKPKAKIKMEFKVEPKKEEKSPDTSGKK